MDRSDVEFLDNGNIKIFGKEYAESFFRTISEEIADNVHVYLTEENGLKEFNRIKMENVTINQ